MKKYLMIGFAALAFASCAKHDFETMTQEQIVKAEYDAKFVAHFQQPASNHTWGFGSSTRAFTRAGAEPKANMWADDGYKAPVELTAGQRLRVKAYFQANPNLTYVDPQLTDFFVQQVYKGGTDPGAISSEVYYQVNGTPVVGSNQMDHLTFGLNSDGTAKDHVNNFNHGRYSSENAQDPNGTPRDNVQNWPDTNITYNNDNGNGTHWDHIMLLLGSSTECVGFISSGNSAEHNDCMALAGAAAIDAWARDYGNNIGEPVDDGWGRSFVGLDYEQMEVSQAYIGQTAKALDFMNGGTNFVIYQNQIYKASEFADFDLVDPYNHAVQYITDNVSNMGIGKKMTYTTTENDQEVEKDVTKSYYNYTTKKADLEAAFNTTLEGNTDVQVFNLDIVMTYVNSNCLPTQNNGNWVKDLGGRDYVYSDWIICLTDGTKITTEEFPDFQGRIMAEDLTAGVDVTGRKSDWDFNDVVFDWAISEDGSKAYVELLAAGGELQIQIGGTLADGVVTGGIEIHSAAGLGAYMCNTGLKTVPTKKLIINAPNGTKFESGNDILLTVLKNGVWMEIPARRGEPTAKFNCLTTTKWCDEYVDIKKAYSKFNAWVGNESENWQESQYVVGDLVDRNLDNNAAVLDALGE